MIRCSVVGASGFAGAELVRWLAQHPDVALASLHAGKSAGQPWESLYPEYRHIWQGTVQPFDEDILMGSDVVFLAQPHQQAVISASKLWGKVGHIIDLSGGLRLDHQDDYLRWYGEIHPNPELMKAAVYGLPELFRTELPGAKLVACAGCYATAAQLAVAPALRLEGIDPNRVALSGLSGTSGAGRKADVELSFTKIAGNLRAYRIGHHQHVPEIQNGLERFSNHRPYITFVPHLMPIDRGILLTAVIQRRGALTQTQVLETYEKTYENAAFVRIVDPSKTLPEVASVRGTNFCDIAPVIDEPGQSLVVVAALDNLIKGAAGQAIQIFNIVCSLPETRGLMPEATYALARAEV